ncbi:MAG: AAA family ATPase [Candidatus Saccharibacteria bacterium]|nr:AAA family ATPase [Candidatus Saccharibacteria bacterium]
MIQRFITSQIADRLGRGKVIIVTGARQVGKTTLTQELLKQYSPDKILVFNGDNLEAQKLSKMSSNQIKAMITGYDCLLIDEAHKINRIGDIVKSLVDELGSSLQIILTGSSTINLIDNTKEPLTGRKRVFELFPISIGEMNLKPPELQQELDTILRFGLYPEIVNEISFQDKQEALLELAQSSIYRDVLDITGTRAFGDLVALLRYLAQNIGQTLSINEASSKLSIDRRTIDRYINLLIKSYVVFSLYPYSKRGSISRAYKVYFWDIGIRNALAEDLTEVNLRQDRHVIWQNFCIAERLKQIKYQRILSHHYFWKSYDGAEVDLVELIGQDLYGFRFSYETKNLRPSTVFQTLNPKSQEIINAQNFISSSFCQFS